MKLRLTLAALALTALGASAANASTVFSETFDVTSGFAGSTIIPGNGDSATSDRWAVTDYTTINNVNGWTFTGSTAYAEEMNSDNRAIDGALLLNEPDGAATNVAHLIVGNSYTLSFLVWGDNRPTQAYSLSSSITGLNTTSFATFSSVDGAPGTNPGTLLSFNFVADATSETLRFTQGNLSAASPIIDNISIADAVPEPATWALFLAGFGGIGFMLRKGRKAAAAATA